MTQERTRPSDTLIVPLLFPDAVARVRSGAESHYQPLLSESLDSLLPDEPLLCFVQEGDDESDALALEEHPDLRERARRTMAFQAEVPFTIDLGKKVRAGVFGANAFSASNLICPEQMRVLGELLGSQELWVGVPRGNTLYAVATSTGHEGYRRLLTMIDKLCRSDAAAHFVESPLVSYSVWRVSEGHVVGRQADGPEKPRRRFLGR